MACWRGCHFINAMKTAALTLLLLVLAGCARVNRYHGNFYGQAKVAGFEDSEGNRHTGVLLYVDRSDELKVIGKDNKYLPTSGFSAVLLNSDYQLIPPEKVNTNTEIVVKGTMDIAQPQAGKKTPLKLVGSKPDDFRPSIRVRRIETRRPTP